MIQELPYNIRLPQAVIGELPHNIRLPQAVIADMIQELPHNIRLPEAVIDELPREIRLLQTGLGCSRRLPRRSPALLSPLKILKPHSPTTVQIHLVQMSAKKFMLNLTLAVW